MATRAIELCDAVVTALNDAGRSWVGTFTAERKVIPPEFNREENTSRKCIVSPNAIGGGVLVSRDGKTQDDYTVYVAVLKSIDSTETDSPAEMERLEVIRDWFKANRRISGYSLVSVDTTPLIHPAHARAKLYFGLLTLVYRVVN